MTPQTVSSLHLSNLRLPQAPDVLTELWIENGRFVSAAAESSLPFRSMDLAGRLVLPGLIETHIHLDKACILNRCQLTEGTLTEAIAQSALAKAHFDEEDIYRRGAEVIEKSIVQGTTHMRTHVEIDPIIGLTGLHAIQRLQRDYAWAITLEICVFPQEGMLNNPGTEELLCRALDEGADVLGGCPYTDSDPVAQIRRLFELAQEYDRDLDFHLDFDLNPAQMTLPEVIRCTIEFGWQKRVTVGHVTKLAAIPPQELQRLGNELAAAGVRVTCLPSTDLYLNGRDSTFNIPRGIAPLAALHECGVICSLSSNNIGNPFTPYGDASLIRQANLFANVSHLGTSDELQLCMDWISTESAQLLQLHNYGLEPGCWADFIVIDAATAAAAIGEIQHPLMGFKRGRQTFTRTAPQLLK